MAFSAVRRLLRHEINRVVRRHVSTWVKRAGVHIEVDNQIRARQAVPDADHPEDSPLRPIRSAPVLASRIRIHI
jgi:hypothetical protein